MGLLRLFASDFGNARRVRKILRAISNLGYTSTSLTLSTLLHLSETMKSRATKKHTVDVFLEPNMGKFLFETHHFMTTERRHIFMFCYYLPDKL